MSSVPNKQTTLMNSKESLVTNTETSEESSDVPNVDNSNEISERRKSVEDLLSGSPDVIGSTISQALSFTSGTVLQASPILLRRSPSPSISPTNSPKPTNNNHSKHERNHSYSKSDSHLAVTHNTEINNKTTDTNDDSTSKSSDSSYLTGNESYEKSPTNGSVEQTDTGSQIVLLQPIITKPLKHSSKISERAKKKSWYSVLYPSYKSRSEDFKKLFKGVPDDERLVVDYSCALQREILVHGRLYVSQNYLCFYANIFRWETCLTIKWKDVTSITKEKTALVIPNAIIVRTENERHFVTSFATRDKAYLMLFRVWQNALMDKPMQPQEMWQMVHNSYGDELGLTSDDEDYIDPYENPNEESFQLLGNCSNMSAESVSEDHSEPPSSDKNDTSKKQSIAPKLSTDHLLKPKPDPKPPHRKIIRKRRDDGALLAPLSEQLPTDISDSSDSDGGTPFVNTASCTSMHEGRQMVHTILPINVDVLFNLMFSKSKFLVEFHNGRKTTNLVHRDWIENEDGLKQRTINLTVALTQAVGPKCSHVTETQVQRECTLPGELYSIDMTSTNAGIPYADSFYVVVHYCLIRTVDDHTMFSVHAQVKYKKSVWGVVKGFIEKNTWNGLEDFYTALLRALQSEYCIPPAKSKGRRTRRNNTLPRDESNKPSKLLPLSLTVPSIPLQMTLPKSSSLRNETISVIVIVLLISLILLNVILFYKLYAIENDSTMSLQFPDMSTLKNPPSSHEGWIKLLQQQEALHTNEMSKWQNVLQTAIELLRKTENTLNDLLHLINVQKTNPSHLTETTIPNGANLGADEL